MYTDGDLVTIFDSSDVMSAIQCSRTLKLRIFLNNPNGDSAESKHSKGVANIGAIRKELSGIRDRVIHLLDQLEIAPQEPQNRESPLQIESEKQAVKPVPTHTKEFDPYQQQNDVGKEADKVTEAFGVEPSTQNENVVSPAPRPPNAVIQPTMSAQQMPNVAGMQQQPQIPNQQQLSQQQQGMQNNAQHPMQQSQPTIGSPYPSPAYQQQALGQQRFQQPQTSTPGYTLSTQQPSAYPQAGYSPQPIQQPYTQPMPYNPQGSTQQQQNQPQVPPGQTGAPSYSASQPTQAYNPPVPSQGQALGQPQGQAGFNYPGYQPTATIPNNNPYSRGAQPAPPYASRPQPPQYR